MGFVRTCAADRGDDIALTSIAVVSPIDGTVWLHAGDLMSRLTKTSETVERSRREATLLRNLRPFSYTIGSGCPGILRHGCSRRVVYDRKSDSPRTSTSARCVVYSLYKTGTGDKRNRRCQGRTIELYKTAIVMYTWPVLGYRAQGKYIYTALHPEQAAASVHFRTIAQRQPDGLARVHT